MGNFNEALHWLKNGHNVCRPGWLSNSYWKLGKGESILWADGTTAVVHLRQIRAEDWEIHKKRVTKEDVRKFLQDEMVLIVKLDCKEISTFQFWEAREKIMEKYLGGINLI